ncbi:MAG TPA: type II toxin-antitoxin system prevent-host-death family antitoxin [Cellvibrio sp.]|uniref:type II toxin-antitoxin system Phd/YefM family antitoxin n=1 Tax=Cellvibrio sp. TaxID=1965322 RepID=UPI000EC9B74A|nr:type II toxin-antitoxin system prevent-host-death family antitoxin [Cellvibrio sp.]HCS63157.1 type II toxin-antitoxin system prevent-host-death family antitoxin [Cellvibrio sp.]
MQTINIHEAKTHLSRLVELAAKGDSFIIAKAGKPLVKVTALNSPEPAQMKRTGFLAGQFQVPDDFDVMGANEIAHLFGVDK